MQITRKRRPRPSLLPRHPPTRIKVTRGQLTVGRMPFELNKLLPGRAARKLTAKTSHNISSPVIQDGAAVLKTCPRQPVGHYNTPLLNLTRANKNCTRLGKLNVSSRRRRVRALSLVKGRRLNSRSRITYLVMWITFSCESKLDVGTIMEYPLRKSQ